MNKSRLVIDSNKNNLLPNFKELIRYKDLFYTLAWRDFKIRYAQTLVGLLWAFIQPIATLTILYVVFGRFAKVETGNVPHLVFTVCGTSVWAYFSYVMTNSGNSIISAQDMVKKIYFPRLIIPLSKAVVGLIDLSVNLIILIILLFWYGIVPSANIIYFPLFIFMGVLAALGVGIWLSALTIRFRDFQQIVPFMVQLGLYITPVAYPAKFALQNLPDSVASIYFLNPMAGIVQGVRWSLLGGDAPGNMATISFVMVVLLFVSSLFYFSSAEKKMADIL
ncbi:MAG: ABC transporter permease [Flavobacteriales bacterium]|nr:ABC transporter permease [Flavobacteriales bacterium]